MSRILEILLLCCGGRSIDLATHNGCCTNPAAKNAVVHNEIVRRLACMCKQNPDRPSWLLAAKKKKQKEVLQRANLLLFAKGACCSCKSV
jgi:hypothetical protein